MLPDKTKCFKCAWNQKSTGITSVYLLRTRPNLWKKNEFIWQFTEHPIPIKWNTTLPKYVMYPDKIGQMKAVSEKKIFQEKKRLNNVGIRSSTRWNLTLKIIWSCRSISNFKTQGKRKPFAQFDLKLHQLWHYILRKYYVTKFSSIPQKMELTDMKAVDNWNWARWRNNMVEKSFQTLNNTLYLKRKRMRIKIKHFKGIIFDWGLLNGVTHSTDQMIRYRWRDWVKC